MSTATDLATNMLSLSGNFQPPTDGGETLSIGQDLEFAASILYTMSRRRLDISLNRTTPEQVAQLQRDNAFAIQWFDKEPDYAGRAAGITNGLYSQAGASLDQLLQTTDKYSVALWTYNVSRTRLATSLVAATSRTLARIQEDNYLRDMRDKAFNMLIADIEIGIGVDGIARSVEQSSMADMEGASKDALGAKTHELNLQTIQLSYDRQAARLGAKLQQTPDKNSAGLGYLANAATSFIGAKWGGGGNNSVTIPEIDPSNF